MARRDFDPATVRPDGRPATKGRLFDPATEGPWRGSLPGLTLGGQNTVLAYGTDTVGAGPRLHVHPYDETFIVAVMDAFPGAKIGEIKTIAAPVELPAIPDEPADED